MLNRMALATTAFLLGMAPRMPNGLTGPAIPNVRPRLHRGRRSKDHRDHYLEMIALLGPMLPPKPKRGRRRAALPTESRQVRRQRLRILSHLEALR